MQDVVKADVRRQIPLMAHVHYLTSVVLPGWKPDVEPWIARIVNLLDLESVSH